MDHGGNVHRPGQGSPYTEPFRCTQGKFQRPISSHGKSSRPGILPAGGKLGEHLPTHVGKFLTQICPIRKATGHIRIEAQVHCRHDNGNPCLGRVPFNGGAPLPHRMVSVPAVKQVQSPGRAWGTALHSPDLGTWISWGKITFMFMLIPKVSLKKSTCKNAIALRLLEKVTHRQPGIHPVCNDAVTPHVPQSR